MDFGHIISVFNSMKNNNLSGTAPSYEPEEEKLTVLQNLEKAKNFLRYDLTDAVISLETALQDTDEIGKSKIQDIITFIKRKDVLTAQNILNQLITICQLKQASDAMLGEDTETIEPTYECPFCLGDPAGQDCSNCFGNGQHDFGWGETKNCHKCEGTGKQPCRCGNGLGILGESDEEEPTGQYGVGQVATKDHYKKPAYNNFKNNIMGEKYSDEDINNHELTIDQELEQEHIEEGYIGDKRIEEPIVKGVWIDTPWQKGFKDENGIFLLKQGSNSAYGNFEGGFASVESAFEFNKTYLNGEYKIFNRYKKRFSEGREQCGKCSARTSSPSIDLCDNCYRDWYKQSQQIGESVMKKINECDSGTAGCAQDRDSINVSSNYNSENDEKSFTVTARNDKADELESILKLSGLMPSGNNAPQSEIAPEPQPATTTGLSAVIVGEAKSPARWCDECKGIHSPESECPNYDDEGLFGVKESKVNESIDDGEPASLDDLDINVCKECGEPADSIVYELCQNCLQRWEPIRKPVEESKVEFTPKELDKMVKIVDNHKFEPHKKFVDYCKQCGSKKGHKFHKEKVKEGFSEFPSELDDQWAEKNSMYCDRCGGYHDGECPPDIDQDACALCHENEAEGESKFCHSCLEYGDINEATIPEYEGSDEDWRKQNARDSEFGNMIDDSFDSQDDENPKTFMCRKCKHEFPNSARGNNGCCDWCSDSKEDELSEGHIYDQDTKSCGNCGAPREVGIHGEADAEELCADCYKYTHDHPEIFGDNRINGDESEFGNFDREPDDFETYNQNEADDYREEFNESKLNEASGYYIVGHIRGYEKGKNNIRECYVKRILDHESNDPDYILIRLIFQKERATIFDDLSEAKKYAADAKTRFRMLDVAVKPQMADVLSWPTDKKVNRVEESTMNESLSPDRRKEGLNGAPRTWSNEPNEQIAGWRALIQDTDGLSQPHDMFNPVKGSDNILTVAKNKEEEKLHENNEVNALATKLQKKFSSLAEEVESKETKKCPECGYDKWDGKHGHRYGGRKTGAKTRWCVGDLDKKKEKVDESDNSNGVYFITHSGDEYYAPNKEALLAYRTAVKNKDWDKVRHFEENWTSLDSIKAKNARKKKVDETSTAVLWTMTQKKKKDAEKKKKDSESCEVKNKVDETHVAATVAKKKVSEDDDGAVYKGFVIRQANDFTGDYLVYEPSDGKYGGKYGNYNLVANGDTIQAIKNWIDKKIATSKGVTETRVAATVAKKKEEKPGDYCKASKCLYRTKEDYCPKHKKKVVESKELVDDWCGDCYGEDPQMSKCKTCKGSGTNPNHKVQPPTRKSKEEWRKLKESFKKTGTCSECGKGITHDKEGGWKHTVTSKGEKPHKVRPEIGAEKYDYKKKVAESIKNSGEVIADFLIANGFKKGISGHSYSHWSKGDHGVSLYPQNIIGRLTPDTRWEIYTSANGKRVRTAKGIGLADLQKASAPWVAPVAESVSKSQAKKLQGMLDNLEKRVKKLGAPPSPQTKITQSMERFRTKIDALKDHLKSRGESSESDESSEKDSGEEKSGKKDSPFKKKSDSSDKPKKDFPAKKSSNKPKSDPPEDGEEAEPKPKKQKETKSDKPDTNGGDSAPAGKVKDIGKGIYEGSTERDTKTLPLPESITEDFSPVVSTIMDKMEEMHSNVIETYGYDVVQEAAQEVADWSGEVGRSNVGTDMLTRRVISILQGNNYRGGKIAESSLDLIKDYRAIVTEERVNVKSREFDTEEEADTAMDKYLDNYHPAGYGTSLKLKQNENGKWIYTGSRYDSCD